MNVQNIYGSARSFRNAAARRNVRFAASGPGGACYWPAGGENRPACGWITVISMPWRFCPRLASDRFGCRRAEFWAGPKMELATELEIAQRCPDCETAYCRRSARCMGWKQCWTNRSAMPATGVRRQHASRSRPHGRRGFYRLENPVIGSFSPTGRGKVPTNGDGDSNARIEAAETFE